MRRVDAAALAGVALLLAGAFVYGQRDEPALPPGPDLEALRTAADLEPCPEALAVDLEGITLPCLGGGPDVEVGGVPALPTVVNVWGTWCPPCVDEVPDLVDFAADAAGKVQVVGVLTTDRPENGLEFARQYGMRYPNVLDVDNLVRARYGTGAPLTLFVDAKGTVRHVRSGKVESTAELEALTAEHLGVRL